MKKIHGQALVMEDIEDVPSEILFALHENVEKNSAEMCSSQPGANSSNSSAKKCLQKSVFSNLRQGQER